MRPARQGPPCSVSAVCATIQSELKLAQPLEKALVATALSAARAGWVRTQCSAASAPRARGRAAPEVPAQVNRRKTRRKRGELQLIAAQKPVRRDGPLR